jgi:hypothetical protein
MYARTCLESINSKEDGEEGEFDDEAKAMGKTSEDDVNLSVEKKSIGNSLYPSRINGNRILAGEPEQGKVFYLDDKTPLTVIYWQCF